MSSIAKWSLWQRRWAMFWWSLGIIGLIVLTLALYPTIRSNAAELNKSFSGLNSTALALFGGTDFFSPIGYLNSQIIYLVLPLVLSILSVGLGGSLIGHEEADRTIETLLSRPVSRTKLLLAKAQAGFFDLLLVTFLSSFATILLAKIVNMGIPLTDIAAACVACFMLVLTFGSVAFLLAAVGLRRGTVIGIAAAYGIGGYVISSLAATASWLNGISHIFPYHYYHSAQILQGSFDWSVIIFSACLSLACLLMSISAFRRRDIH